MECGNLLPLSGLQPPANTPVRAFRSPNSDLRSPTPCVPDVRSSAFSRLAQYRPRQEPRKTRNTRKESENRTGGRRGSRDVPCNDECRKSNDERSPKSQIDASLQRQRPSAPISPPRQARPDLPSPICDLRASPEGLRPSASTLVANCRSTLRVVNVQAESTRRVERRRWAGSEGVSAAQDLRLRVRAPLSLSTSTSAKFVLVLVIVIEEVLQRQFSVRC